MFVIKLLSFKAQLERGEFPFDFEVLFSVVLERNKLNSSTNLTHLLFLSRPLLEEVTELMERDRLLLLK